MGEGMLRVQDVHMLRHKVLVEGKSQRAVAREMGVSRNTVRRYLTLAEPVRVEQNRGGSRPLNGCSRASMRCWRTKANQWE